MSSKLSRRSIAQYVASKTVDGRVPADVVQELAAYLLENGRTREVEQVVRAIYDALEAKGEVVAEATTAHKLSEEAVAALKNLVGGKKLHLSQKIQPEVIGGIKLETPSAYLDTTIAHQLTLLASAKQ